VYEVLPVVLVLELSVTFALSGEASALLLRLSAIVPVRLVKFARSDLSTVNVPGSVEATHAIDPPESAPCARKSETAPVPAVHEIVKFCDFEIVVPGTKLSAGWMPAKSETVTTLPLNACTVSPAALTLIVSPSVHLSVLVVVLFSGVYVVPFGDIVPIVVVPSLSVMPPALTAVGAGGVVPPSGGGV
jgi:hypothetical protein